MTDTNLDTITVRRAALIACIAGLLEAFGGALSPESRAAIPQITAALSDALAAAQPAPERVRAAAEQAAEADYRWMHAASAESFRFAALAEDTAWLRRNPTAFLARSWQSYVNHHPDYSIFADAYRAAMVRLLAAPTGDAPAQQGPQP